MSQQVQPGAPQLDNNIILQAMNVIKMAQQMGLNVEQNQNVSQSMSTNGGGMPQVSTGMPMQMTQQMQNFSMMNQFNASQIPNFSTDFSNMQNKPMADSMNSTFAPNLNSSVETYSERAQPNFTDQMLQQNQTKMEVNISQSEFYR